MQAHSRVAHIPLNLFLRCQGSHRVDHQNVNRTGTDELVGNFESLFSVVGLGYVEVVHIGAQLLSIEAVEGMLGINEGSDATGFLTFSDGMDGQRGLAARFRTINLNDASLGVASHAQCSVQRNRSRGNHVYRYYRLVAHAHNAAFAKVFLYLRHSGLQGFQFLLLRGQCFTRSFFFCHSYFFLFAVKLLRHQVSEFQIAVMNLMPRKSLKVELFHEGIGIKLLDVVNTRLTPQALTEHHGTNHSWHTSGI